MKDGKGFGKDDEQARDQKIQEENTDHEENSQTLNEDYVPEHSELQPLQPWSQVLTPIVTSALKIQLKSQGYSTNKEGTQWKLTFYCKNHRAVYIILAIQTSLLVEKAASTTWNVQKPKQTCKCSKLI